MKWYIILRGYGFNQNGFYLGPTDQDQIHYTKLKEIIENAKEYSDESGYYYENDIHHFNYGDNNNPNWQHWYIEEGTNPSGTTGAETRIFYLGGKS